MGDDPHFSVILPDKKILCFSVMGDHGFSYNLISNKKVTVNALFSPDSERDEVTWIGGLGIIARNSDLKNQVSITLTANPPSITFNKATLSPHNVKRIIFKADRVVISDKSPSSVPEGPQPSVLVFLESAGLSFSVHFMREHLDMFWHNNTIQDEDSDGLVGLLHNIILLVNYMYTINTIQS